MSYYIHPDVDNLKRIADDWWKKQSSWSISTTCWAVQDPYSECMARFIKWYRLGQTTDFESMTDDKFQDALRKYLCDIDDLFFFSLLTRSVKHKDRSSELVHSRVMSELPKGDYIGTYRIKDNQPYIRIYRKNRRGKTNSFERLLQVLIHESIHAYLGIFCDSRHSKHTGWVADYDGHGEMFWVLLRFIAGKIMSYTRSEAWKKQLKYVEEECYDTTKTKGGPGSWGTPERTLMGTNFSR